MVALALVFIPSLANVLVRVTVTFFLSTLVPMHICRIDT